MTATARWAGKGLALMMVVGILAACGLPRSGPTKSEIFEGSVLESGDAFVVTVNDRVTRATSVVPAFGFGSSFRKRRRDRFGPDRAR